MDDPDVFIQIKFVHFLQEAIHISGTLRGTACAQILRCGAGIFLISRVGRQAGTDQRRQSLPITGALAAPGNKTSHAQRERGGIPGRSLPGTDAGEEGSVVAQIPGKLRIADGKGVQQLVEVAAKVFFIEGFFGGQSIPESSFHRPLGDFCQTPLLCQGSDPGSQLPPLLPIRLRALSPPAIPADDRRGNAAGSR